MKPLFKFLGVSVLTFCLSYLLSSFVSVTLYMRLWDPALRGAIAIVTGFVMLLSGIFILLSTLDMYKY